MAAPTYQGNGGIAYGASTSVAVTYPSLQQDDILIIQLISNDGSADHQQPSGFSAIQTQTTQASNATFSWWWKRASGSESGTLSCTRSGATGDGFWGVMSCWRGAVGTGTPFNTVATQTGRNSSALSTSITPSYNNARIICLLQVEDNLGQSAFDGGNYAENFDLPDGSTTDAEISACSFGQTTLANEPQRTSTIGGTDSWSTCTLALWSSTATTHSLAGSIGAASAVTGQLKITRSLAGSVAAQATLVGDLVPTATHELAQQSFRWRYNDGTQATATWMEVANANPSTIYPLCCYRLRFLIEEVGGAAAGAAANYRYFYRKNSGTWTEIVTGTGGEVVLVGSALVDAGDTTQQLGSGSFITDNNAMIERPGNGYWTLPAAWPASYECETEISFRLDYTLNTNGDVFEFQVRNNDGSVLSGGYANTPTITLTKPATTRFELKGWRFRTDDGDEATATWLAPAQQPTTLEAGTTYRIRWLIEEQYGYPIYGTEVCSWRMHRSLNSGGWTLISPTSGVMQSVAASNLVNQGDTTQQLGSGSFYGSQGQSEDGVAEAGTLYTGGYEHEVEFSIVVLDVGTNPGDVIDLKILYTNHENFDTALTVSNPQLRVGFRQTLAGSIAAASTVSGDATVEHAVWDLEGSIAALSVVTGDATIQEAVWDLQGSVSAASALTGALAGKRQLAGAIASQAALVGDLEVIVGGTTWDLAGNVAAQSALAGQCYVPSIYYIASEGTAPNPAAADGLSYPGGFMDVTEHNSNTTYTPGDLFVIDGQHGIIRVNDDDMLKPQNSGAAGLPIRYTGINDAILSGADLLGDAWTSLGSNRWSISRATVPLQVLFDSQRGHQRPTLDDVVDEFDWFWSGGTLNVYCTHDPFDEYDERGVEVTDSNGRTNCASYADGAKDWIVWESITFSEARQYSFDANNLNLTGLEIKGDCKFLRSYYAGCRVTGDDAGAGMFSVNIHDAEAAYNGGHGIVCGGKMYGTISRRNRAHHNGHYEFQPGVPTQQKYTAGLKWTGENNEAFLCEQNEVSYQNTTHPDGPVADKGCGIWTDVRLWKGGTIRHNWTHHNKKQGVRLEITANVKCYANVVDHNEDGSIGVHANNNEGLLGSTWDNAVFNNILYANKEGLRCGAGGTGAVLIGNLFKNNICLDNTNAELYTQTGGQNDATLLTLATTLDGAAETQIDVGAGNIPGGTPATGYIALRLDTSFVLALAYTAHDSDRYFTIAATDFTDPDDATAGNQVYLGLGYGNVYESNCFGAQTSGFLQWNGVGYDTYDAWLAASGQPDNNIEASPQLVDPANNKFWLSESSPCRDAALDLGASYSLGLNYASTWPTGVLTLDQDECGAGWDLGAFPYIGQLAGAIAAQSALSGEVELWRKLAGAIAAQTAVAGDVEVTRKLAGAVAAQSSITGSLVLVKNLAGSAAAQSALVGDVRVTRKLVGSIAAQSAVSGDAKITRQLAGSVAAQSSITGSLVRVKNLAGTVAAQSALVGDVRVTRKLAGTIAAQSALSGELKLWRKLVGTVAAQSALSGDAKVTRKLAGGVAAQSALVGNLELSGMWALAGAVSSSSSLAATLKLQQRLQGTVSAFSSLVADLQVQHETWDLDGDVAATSTLAGNLRVTRKLVGVQIAERVRAEANLIIQHATWNLAGSVAASSSLTGSLKGKLALAGSLSAQSALTGNLQLAEALWNLMGTIRGQSSLVGNLVNLGDLPKLLSIHGSWISIHTPQLTLTEIPLLLVSNSTHYHYASNVYVHQQLVIANGTHAHSAANITFVLLNRITIQNPAHTVTSEEVDLLNSLLIANAQHYHLASNVNIPYGPGAREGLGLGDAVFGLKPTMKLPPYPMRQEELLKWCQQLYWELQNSYIPQTDRIENMTMVGLEEQRPAPVGRRQLFYAFDTQSLWIDVMTEDADGVWSADWFAVAAGVGTNEIHHTSLPDSDSQFLFEADFVGGEPGGCIIQYSAYMAQSSSVYARETGIVQITGVYPNYTITKVTSPAVAANGGSATFTFTQEATARDMKVYCTGVASGFTPVSDKLTYTVWLGGNTSYVLYSDTG